MLDDAISAVKSKAKIRRAYTDKLKEPILPPPAAPATPATPATTPAIIPVPGEAAQHLIITAAAAATITYGELVPAALNNHAEFARGKLPVDDDDIPVMEAATVTAPVVARIILTKVGVVAMLKQALFDTAGVKLARWGGWKAETKASRCFP